MEKKPEAVGIIAEYNPFHKGHKYHLDEALERSGAEVCIAVISGNFTQRGEIALLNKWTRAEMAVKNGINLVVEMPAVFACSNAGYFAKAGVEILESMNADYICFGSESGIGGAVYMNARCFDRSISDILYSTTHLQYKGDKAQQIELPFDSKDWDYKKSPFQSTKDKNQLYITQATFRLTPAGASAHDRITTDCNV